jgi:hypothetical protein
MQTAYDTSPDRAELALVRSALARALHQDPPDLAALNAALGRVDKLLAHPVAQPSAAGNAVHASPRVRTAALPIARGFFAG